jgi:hypothetical protein
VAATRPSHPVVHTPKELDFAGHNTDGAHDLLQLMHRTETPEQENMRHKLPLQFTSNVKPPRSAETSLRTTDSELQVNFDVVVV